MKLFKSQKKMVALDLSQISHKLLPWLEKWSFGLYRRVNRPYNVSIGKSWGNSLSLCRWGKSDFTWLVAPNKMKPIGESTIWGNLCNCWEGLRPHISPMVPANWEERKRLPLWVPHMIHNKAQDMDCKLKNQQRLRNGGGDCRWHHWQTRCGPTVDGVPTDGAPWVTSWPLRKALG